MDTSKHTSLMERFGLPLFITVLFMPDFIALPALVVFAVFWLYKFIVDRHFKWSFLWLFLAYAVFVAWRAENVQGYIGVGFVFILYTMIVFYRKKMTPDRYNLMQYQITLASLVNFFFNFVDLNPKWLEPVTNVLDMFIKRGHLPQYRHGYFRAYSTFDNPNIYAFVLLLVLLVIFNQIELQIAFKRKKETLFYCGAFAVNAYALLLTQTRSILIALGIGMVVILFAQERWTQLKGLIFVGSIVAIYLLINPDLFPRFTQLEEHAPIRFEIWENAISQIKRNPFLGEGFFTYSLHFDNSDAHNIFIDTLLNFGIVGVFIMAVYAIEVAHKYLRDAHNLDIPLALGILSSVIIYGVFDIPLYSIQPVFLLALVFIIPKRTEPQHFMIQDDENNVTM